MLHPIIILLLAAVFSAHLLPSDAVNATNFNDDRIIGGNEVVKNSYPFVVRIEGRTFDGVPFLCGASLLHDYFVVTAAHCVYGVRKPIVAVTLHFGDHNARVKETTQSSMYIPLDYIRPHPQYNEQTITNDIALIKLPQPVPQVNHVRPICVASPERTTTFGWATAIGWGQTHNNGEASDVLKEVNLPILPHEECRNFQYFNPSIMVCAGNSQGYPAAVCFGDSGGPFVANPGNPLLVGLTSFVLSKGCVYPGFPVVFTRVPTYIPWLRSMMGSSLCVV